MIDSDLLFEVDLTCFVACAGVVSVSRMCLQRAHFFPFLKWKKGLWPIHFTLGRRKRKVVPK